MNLRIYFLRRRLEPKNSIPIHLILFKDVLKSQGNKYENFRLNGQKQENKIKDKNIFREVDYV